MKIAIEVLAEWDKENVIAFFEKHYPNCNVWSYIKEFVGVGEIWYICSVENTLTYRTQENYKESDYTLLKGVPKDMELPKPQSKCCGRCDGVNDTCILEEPDEPPRKNRPPHPPHSVRREVLVEECLAKIVDKYCSPNRDPLEWQALIEEAKNLIQPF